METLSTFQNRPSSFEPTKYLVSLPVKALIMNPPFVGCNMISSGSYHNHQWNSFCLDFCYVYLILLFNNSKFNFLYLILYLKFLYLIFGSSSDRIIKPTQNFSVRCKIEIEFVGLEFNTKQSTTSIQINQQN